MSTTPVKRFPANAMLNSLTRFRAFDYAVLVGQSVLFYGVELLIGPLIQRIVDLLAASTQVPGTVWVLIAALFVTMLVGRATLPIWFWASGRFQTGLGTLMRRNMLAHVMKRPAAQALPASAGEAVSRFFGDATDVLWFLTLLPDMPLQILTLAVMLIVLAQVNLGLTLVAMIPIGLSLLAAQLSGRLVKQQSRAKQDAVGAVTGSLGEIFGAVQAIKLAGAEPGVSASFERAGEVRRKTLLRLTLVTEVLESFSWNTAALTTAGVLLAAVLTGEINRMKPGELALFVTYFSAMNFLVGFFGELLNRYRHTVVSLQRMSEVLIDAPPEALTAHNPVYLDRDPPAIPALPERQRLAQLEARRLSFTYPGSANGIVDCAFTLPRGGLTVITGRVGAGKTTLLRSVLGLLPAGGEVRWNGSEIEKRDVFFKPPHSAYVPQIPRLFSDTLRENILMGAGADATRLDEAIRLAVFERDVAEFEKGLETPVGVRGTKVSGGQLQRTAAARAFVRAPELIVVDDLSSALDGETETLLWQRVFEQGGERTILAVSTRPAALERAQHVIVMREGRVIDQGTLDVLLERCDELRAIYQGQGGLTIDD
jgi:ATP-binding cassette, subfamily B, bacterial